MCFCRDTAARHFLASSTEKPPSGVFLRLALRPSPFTTTRLLPDSDSSSVRRQPAGCGVLTGGLPPGICRATEQHNKRGRRTRRACPAPPCRQLPPWAILQGQGEKVNITVNFRKMPHIGEYCFWRLLFSSPPVSKDVSSRGPRPRATHL